jgi:hypothetical protein
MYVYTYVIHLEQLYTPASYVLSSSTVSLKFWSFEKQKVSITSNVFRIQYYYQHTSHSKAV